MTIKNIKTKIKASINNKPEIITTNVDNKKQKRSKLLLIVTFFSGVLLIISSYAWLSASLNVKVKFFDLSVSTDNGLFISLDGIDFSDTVELSSDSIITDLKSSYSNHTNQWASGGLWPVSSNGIKTTASTKFDVYSGEVSRRKNLSQKRYLNTKLISEENSNSSNIYIAFDLFLKNVSGSPKSDNLYFDEDTSIDFTEDTPDDTRNSLSGVMNSMRFGIVKMGSVSSKSDVRTIQNQKCSGSCEMFIYEPNSTSHSVGSIARVVDYGVVLVDGLYSPTYAVISEGDHLNHANGQDGSGIPLDTAHFSLQNTLTKADFGRSIFKIPNGITKLRAYVWIEGQDMDSLEVTSEGAAIDIDINFVKDLAGYE